jgi:hypothetical protein
MAFQITPLNLPSGRTDYSAENSAFSNLGQTLGNLIPDLQKQRLQQQKQQILGQIGTGNLDYDKAGRSLIALGDTSAGATLLTLGQKQKERDAEGQFFKNFGLGGSATTMAAPAAIGSPNEVESRFLGGVQKAGLTNPNGLAAVAAYGRSESGYAPGNVNKTWSDPAESGAAGTAGGIMSWRADRLQNLQRFAASRGEQGNGSPETQAAFLASEDPTLIPRLNAAQSPQEANQIMAQAWRFGGYDRPGQGEYARREGLTSQYAQRYAGQPQPAAPQQPVQVAENEADVQRLEQEQAARAQAPGQVAQAAPQPGTPVADVPAQGAVPTQGFAIPGTGEVVSQQDLASNPRLQRMIRAYAAAPTDRARAFVKQQMDLELADIKQRQTRTQAQVRPLSDPAERARYGIPEGDKAPYQIDGNGRVTAIGGNKTTVNLKNEGTIPQGFRAVRDEQGNIERLEAIPGSEADQKAKALADKQAKAERIRAETGNSVGNALDDIDRLMKSATLPTTGAMGGRLAGIPGTAAYDIAQSLSTIKANISFDKLQQMRESSPTGGALGSVTEGEQKLLQDSYAALSQSQSEEQFKTNLGRTRAIFERIVHGRTLTPQERKTGGPMTLQRAKGLRDEAAAAIAGGAPRDAVLKRLKEDYGIPTGGL